MRLAGEAMAIYEPEDMQVENITWLELVCTIIACAVVGLMLAQFMPDSDDLIKQTYYNPYSIANLARSSNDATISSPTSRIR